MSNEPPKIYDCSFDLIFCVPGRPEFKRHEAQRMQGKMLVSRGKEGLLGKVIGYHGYRDGNDVIYALDVRWNKIPHGHPSKNMMVLKYSITEKFSVLDGISAKVGEREWLRDQLMERKPGQELDTTKPVRRR